MESWSVHHLNQEANKTLTENEADSLSLYARKLIAKNLPVIFTLKHFSEIVDRDYSFLRNTVEKRREVNNYKMFSIRKRSGGRRFIHAVSGQLLPVQQWINSEILQKLAPHDSSFAFNSKGGIKECAALHCGAKWIFKFDIANFFYCINEMDVFKVFLSAGYHPLIAFELSRICTTTRLPIHLNKYLRTNICFSKEYNFYNSSNRNVGVLPQGGASSPMISNLVAFELDEKLSEYALMNGFTYTRYADDLTFSCVKLPSKKSVRKIQFEITRIMRASGFLENESKTSVAGPGARKMVLGLLVDGEQPRLSKQTYKKLDRYFYSIEKFGLVQVAKHEKFDSVFGFFNHLNGYVSYVKSVDLSRGNEFSERMKKIIPQWTQI